ncbi:hypothetical protein CCR96_02775 [Halochromatium roseum]|nr:hypothetical protein [Halochromatium roseum]
MSRHHYASPTKGLLIDANLLTVMIIGALGVGEVERFKRTREYIDDDVLGLDLLIQQFGWVGTTPHIMTETSNLLDWLDDARRANALGYLARFAQSAPEIGLSSTAVVESPVYYRLGITDAALCLAIERQPLVLLTRDLALYQYASQLRLEVINFNHVRQQWLFD